MINLPVNVDAAKLPAAYEHAKTALAECERIDECKTWADKAQALASYAKQAKDSTLRRHADKIQARAIKRAGELLKLIEPAQGANQNIRMGTHTKVTRESAATDAGMSKHQKDTALRVASVSSEVFESLVESENPPTVTQLAALGTQRIKEHQIRGVGINYASTAINALGRIPLKDGLRQEAFEMVIDWIKHNRYVTGE